MVLCTTYCNLHTMYNVHTLELLWTYGWPAVFDQLISYLHNPIVTLWVAWPTPTKLDCFQSTIVTLMVAQLPLQLLGMAFSSASSLWLWMSKHHNWATKTLTLCQFRPVVKVKWCQELLSKGNLCNLNFDSLSSQACSQKSKSKGVRSYCQKETFVT